MDAELARWGLGVAVGLGRELGVRCDAAEVLAANANVVVWLRPAPVVARVPAMTGIMRHGAHDALAREVDVARYLAGVGAPVVPPSVDPPAGPHVRDGVAVTLWPYQRTDPGRVPSPGRFGAMLRELHDVLAGYPGRLPYLGTPYADIATLLDEATAVPPRPAAEPVADTPHAPARGGDGPRERNRGAAAAPAVQGAPTGRGDGGRGRDGGAVGTSRAVPGAPDGRGDGGRGRDRGAAGTSPGVLRGLPGLGCLRGGGPMLPGLGEAERAAAHDELRGLRTALGAGPGRALHGDGHPGNLLATHDGGWRWTDLEDTCAGPVEWDLACLLRTSRLDGRAAVRAYGRDPDDPRIAPLTALRRLHGGLYSKLIATYRT